MVCQKLTTSNMQRHKVCWLSHFHVPWRKQRLISETPFTAASIPHLRYKYGFTGQAGNTGLKNIKYNLLDEVMHCVAGLLI